MNQNEAHIHKSTESAWGGGEDRAGYSNSVDSEALPNSLTVSKRFSAEDDFSFTATFNYSELLTQSHTDFSFKAFG